MKFFIFALLLIFKVPCFATLGQTEKSIVTDSLKVPGSVHTVQTYLAQSHSQFIVHKISNEGVDVKEFMAPNGKVFAVSWKGMHHLDFETYFGDYFPKYQHSIRTQKRKRGLRSQEFKSEDIVVRLGGHMKAIRGYAYVPKLMPTGLKIEDLLAAEKQKK